MSVVLNRKLFNGNNKPSSRNNGIVSGFDDDNNDSELQQLIDERRKVYQDILPEPTQVGRLEAASPALLALGSALLSGRSLQGGIGGALDILGQGLGASAPLFDQAIQRRRAAEQANVDRQVDIDLAALKSAEDILATRAATKAKGFKTERDANDRLRYVEGPEKGELVFPNVVPEEKGEPGVPKKIYYKNPNFDQDSPVSDENPRYVTSQIRKGTDNKFRVLDNTPNSETFGEFILEDDWKFGYTLENPEKLVTPSSGDVWIKNPAYDENAEGAKASDMFLLTKFKKDKFNNITILDNREGSPTKDDYILDSNFNDYTFSEPKSMIQAEEAKLDKNELYALVQTEFDKLNKFQNKTTRTLSEKELAAIIMRAGDDPGEWEKFSQTFGGSFFELGEILQDYQTPDSNPSEVVTGQDDAGGTETVVTTGVEGTEYRDHIDEKYDLDKNDINYNIKRDRALKNYNQLETFPPDVVDSIISAFDGFKDLKMMADNYDVGIPYGGWIVGVTSKLGLNPRATEFLTGKNGTLVTSTSALIKGIPSDFDVQNLLNTLPSEGEGDLVNFVRIKRLERVYSDIIKNYLAFYGGINYRVPPRVEIIAREMLGNEAVDEALSTEYSAQKLNDLRLLSTAEYIEKYGDPFKSSLDILGLPDSAFTGAKLNEAEQEELEALQKKYTGG